MNIFGIGPFEIVLILIVAFVFLGPQDMAKTGRTVGRFLRRVVLSEEWRAVRHVAQEIQATPTRLIREAGIEEEQLRRELGTIDPRAARRRPAFKPQDFSASDEYAAWTNPPPPNTARPASESSPPVKPPAPDPTHPEA